MKAFLEKAAEVHGETYDYSNVKWGNLKTAVPILCKKLWHGVFMETPAKHLNEKDGVCPKCKKEQEKKLVNGKT